MLGPDEASASSSFPNLCVALLKSPSAPLLRDKGNKSPRYRAVTLLQDFFTWLQIIAFFRSRRVWWSKVPFKVCLNEISL